MHREGDTPTESEDLNDDDDESYDSQESPDMVMEILNRRDNDGRLEYECRMANGEIDWYDRSDLWDDGRNWSLVRMFDVVRPVRWDLECYFCHEEMNESNNGCEECRCDECGAICQMLKGVSYGCVDHPVI